LYNYYVSGGIIYWQYYTLSNDCVVKLALVCLAVLAILRTFK